MKNLTFASLILFLFFACVKEPINDQKNDDPAPVEFQYTQYKAPFKFSQVQQRSSCDWIEIPAGSVDALHAAINKACTNGVIYLKAGEHTENGMVTINKSVKIIGETGAVLTINSDLAPYNDNGEIPILPGIHVQNAPGTLIQDLDIRPTASDGGTAILLQDSDFSAVMRNKISSFQFGIVVEKSDFTTLMLNNIAATSAWLTGEVQEANSIINVNGESTYISDNEISNSSFGVWACSKWGTFERNVIHDNFIGLILCNVPLYLIMPDGQLTMSESPGFGWKVRDNNAMNNFTVGYLVIDGANNNLLENNNASNNGDYDIEITTVTNRFGVPVPAAFENTVKAGNFQNVRIKNCGPDNTVIGGILIDNSLEPCN